MTSDRIIWGKGKLSFGQAAFKLLKSNTIYHLTFNFETRTRLKTNLGYLASWMNPFHMSFLTSSLSAQDWGPSLLSLRTMAAIHVEPVAYDVWINLDHVFMPPSEDVLVSFEALDDLGPILQRESNSNFIVLCGSFLSNWTSSSCLTGLTPWLAVAGPDCSPWLPLLLAVIQRRRWLLFVYHLTQKSSASLLCHFLPWSTLCSTSLHRTSCLIQPRPYSWSGPSCRGGRLKWWLLSPRGGWTSWW